MELAVRRILFLICIKHMAISSALDCIVQANVALGKPTWQSTRNNAYMAVDGNTNQYYTGNSCTHTDANTLEYWAVDLLARYFLHSIKIYNRQDCCAYRLGNFKIFTRKNNDNYTERVFQSDSVGSTVVFQLDKVEARFLKIEKYDGTPLTLCEVQIFGTLPCGYPYELIPNNKGAGTVIQTATVSSSVECAALCTRVSGCQGFNVHNEGYNFICEILSSSSTIADSGDTKAYVPVIN